MGRGKSKYNGVIRYRIPEEWKKRLEAIINARGHGDISELGRTSFIEWVEKEEKRLGLKETGDSPKPQ